MSENARSYGGRPPHGTMAEEAVKLAEVAHLWLVSRSTRAGDDAAPPSADQAQPAECTGCPVCRVRRAVAELNPEVYEHLADAVASLAAALRALSAERRQR